MKQCADEFQSRAPAKNIYIILAISARTSATPCKQRNKRTVLLLYRDLGYRRLRRDVVDCDILVLHISTDGRYTLT
jgi:hypothetical protein